MDNPLNTPKPLPPISDPVETIFTGDRGSKIGLGGEERWIWPATLLFIGFILAVIGLAALSKDTDVRVGQNSERSSPATKPLVPSPPIPQ
jgi:hypothetical protein